MSEGPDGPLYADFHSLRHTFVSLLDQSGATLKEAMQLARHSDPRLTMARYGRAQRHDLAQTVQLAQRMLAKLAGVHICARHVGRLTEEIGRDLAVHRDARAAQLPLHSERAGQAGYAPAVVVVEVDVPTAELVVVGAPVAEVDELVVVDVVETVTVSGHAAGAGASSAPKRPGSSYVTTPPNTVQ